MLLSGTDHGCNFICFTFLQTTKTIYYKILMPFITLTGQHAIDDFWFVSHYIERELAESFKTLRLYFLLNFLIRINIQFLISKKFLKPFLWLLSMPGKRMTIDRNTSILCCGNKRRYLTEIHHTLVVDTRSHLHGIACNNLIEVMGCKTEERTLLVELVHGKCCTYLKARMSITIQILLQWRIVVEVLILSDGLRLLDVIFPVIPVCTAAQNKWADQCRYNIFIYFHTTKFIFISLLRNYFHDSSLLPRLIIDIT